MLEKEFKKQHIVPQAYLKRFATEKKHGKYLIGVINNTNNKVYVKNISDVSYIDNYYDIQKESIKGEKFWEHFYGNNIEPLYSKCLDSIISRILLSNNCKKVLNEENKVFIANLIITQLFRTPNFLDEGIYKIKRSFSLNRRLFNLYIDNYKTEIDFTKNFLKDDLYAKDMKYI